MLLLRTPLAPPVVCTERSVAALNLLEAVRACCPVSTCRGAATAATKTCALQAHNEAELEHASAWALVVSQCGALRGTCTAAERAYGEHAGTYMMQLKSSLRKKKREKQHLGRSAGPVLFFPLSFGAQASFLA